MSISDSISSLSSAIQNPFSQKVSNGKLFPVDFPNGWEIIEYVNGAPIQATAIRFTGNMMPMQPFTWGGKQRSAIQRYPGNPEPSVHILGDEADNVTIHGRFKDKKYKDVSYYGVSYQLALAVDEMRKRGNLVKFGLEGTYKWVRFGYIDKCDFKMNKVSWIDYEITFIVVSETLPVNNYFVSNDFDTPDQINQSLINAATNFSANYSSIPSSVPQSLAGLINGITSAVASQINVVTGFVNTIITTATDVVASANRALGLIKNARTNIAVWGRQLGAIEHTFGGLSSNNNPSAQAAGAYTTSAYLSEIIAALGDIATILAQEQKKLESISQTTPDQQYSVVDGDTLQNIAIKFYGSPSNAGYIYDHNNLQTTVLLLGQVLEIPKVSP